MERKERFNEAYTFLKNRGVIHTQKDLSEKMGASPSNVSSALKGVESVLTNKFLTRFNESFGGVFNTSWLLDGAGSMLAEGAAVDNSSARISYTSGVPYYDVDFMGGFDFVENSQAHIPAYNIDFRLYNHATCWCNITGHSMEPEINHGDIIALRRIEDFSFLPAGEVYAIVTTNDMRTVKRIGVSSNPDCYLLIPTNKSPEYATQEIPKKMIRAVFEVLGCMKKL